MTAPPPSRPWYRRKRVWAAAVLWLCSPAGYVTAYRSLMRPNVTIFWTEGMGASVRASYPHPALAYVFAPAEWFDRRVRPRFWHPD